MYSHSSIVEFIKGIYPSKNFIPLHEPIFSGNEKTYVLDSIESTFVSSVGEYVNRFEIDLARFVGANHCVATVNGTSALHTALLISGVKPNDLVITQSLTFIATCNAISYINAEPVFIDIDRDSLGLSPTALRSWCEDNVVKRVDSTSGNQTCCHKITNQRISAVVPMHTFGMPCRIDEIKSICEEYGMILIEDAAESLGSKYKGQSLGTFGHVGIFSFNGNKIVTSGGGGAIVTNAPVLAKEAKHLTTQAKVPHQWEFNHDRIGFNYRMPNINAALACAQIERLDEFISNKRATAQMYSKFFSGFSNTFFIEEYENALSNYWLNSILFDSRESKEAFLRFSNSMGVMTRPSWTPMHLLPLFKNCMAGDMINTNFINERLVNIPSSYRN